MIRLAFQSIVVRAAITLILFCPAFSMPLVQSQKKKSDRIRPNLNGQWTMDKSKSDVSEFGFTADMAMSLTISQSEPEIRMTRTYIYEDVENQQKLQYFTDQRGETNPTIIVGETLKSKTKWNDDTLISKSSGQTEFGPRLVVYYDRVDEWNLSKDGNTLVHTTRIYNARSAEGQPFLTTDLQNVPGLFGKGLSKRVFRRSVEKQ